VPDISIGRSVIYTLTEGDCQTINERRWLRVRELRSEASPKVDVNFVAKMATDFKGADPAPGMVFPMMVVKVIRPGVLNGQVFLDGNDTLWVQNVTEAKDPRPGCWFSKG
jgi:hypothetical protein